MLPMPLETGLFDQFGVKDLFRHETDRFAALLQRDSISDSGLPPFFVFPVRP